jgi:hypothetical protein
MKLSSKSSGERAELLSAAECCKYGIVVCFPHSDNVPYDFIIDNNKKLYKIQVKSSRFYENGRKIPTFVINYSKVSTKAIDFFVFYDYKAAEYYIIPSKLIKTNCFRPGKRYLLYKNAWHLLKA